MKFNFFFNRKAWAEFYLALTHRHVYESDHGFMSVGPATLIRCKCGHPEWVGLGQTGIPTR
jgi:hypothetical protein